MAAPFDASLYKSIKQCGDESGGHFAAAIEKSSSGVYVSTSADGVTWSTPALVTDSTGTPLSIDAWSHQPLAVYQENAAGSTRFVITNGAGFMIYSDAYGAGNSWSNY